MPLNDDAVTLIRRNLEIIQSGRKPKGVIVGQLTREQLTAINEARKRHNFPPMSEEVIFIGGHMYQSRCTDDGYTIEDMIQQITSAMHDKSIVRLEGRVKLSLHSTIIRDDGYGNRVTDKAVFEFTGKYPLPELYSVIPMGDKNKPKK